MNQRFVPPDLTGRGIDNRIKRFFADLRALVIEQRGDCADISRTDDSVRDLFADVNAPRNRQQRGGQRTGLNNVDEIFISQDGRELQYGCGHGRNRVTRELGYNVVGRI
jgi:hypothetical protein